MSGDDSSFSCGDFNTTDRDDVSQFCSDFGDALPNIYLSISCLSAFCCLWVFATYYLFPRLSGYSSKVFVNRTLVDFLIAVGHIFAGILRLAEKTNKGSIPFKYICGALGTFNEFALVASNLWYAVLAVDLIKAVRNPFSATPTYGYPAHAVIWGVSMLTSVILLTTIASGTGPGLSMFFWCWVSIEGNLIEFTLITLFLYYLLHFILWMFSLVVLLMVCFLLQGHLAASSETRKFVLKQNTIYVLVLGIETGIIISLWLAQLSILYIRDPDNDTHPIFHSEVDYGLAIVFAVVHSLRGTVDLVVWWVTFSIGPKDLRWLYQHLKLKWKRKRHYLSPDTLNTPLIQANTSVNRALRRDAIYCINIGILDAVRLSAENERDKLGSVRDPFVAQMMVHLDDENQEHATAQLREENPQYRELSERKITFPPTGSIQHFAFIDLEPSIFSLLRSSYGVVPTVYRQSFKIKNAADVESSGMLEKFTEGKSGSFFYFTRDFQYIIKTVTSSEERFLQKIAYRYYRHMRNHPDSLIVRLYGLHKVRLAREQRYITVVVMDNIFRNNDLLKVTEQYDLKGSTVGRRVLKGNRERATHKGTLKDLDLDKRIVVGAETKTHLMEQLRQDVDFLASCKIMDYSMLLGIHHHSNAESSLGPRMRSHSIEVVGGEDFIDVNPVDLKRSQEVTPVAGGASNVFEHRPSTSPRRPHSHRISVLPSHNIDSASINETGEYSEPYVPWFRRDFGGLRSYSPFHPCVNMERERGQTVLVEDYNGLDAHSIPVDTYFFGIVDILQEYNWEKKVEHFWKTSIMCKDKHGISAVNEKEYGERFLNAIDRIFE